MLFYAKNLQLLQGFFMGLLQKMKTLEFLQCSLQKPHLFTKVFVKLLGFCKKPLGFHKDFCKNPRACRRLSSKLRFHSVFYRNLVSIWDFLKTSGLLQRFCKPLEFSQGLLKIPRVFIRVFSRVL